VHPKKYNNEGENYVLGEELIITKVRQTANGQPVVFSFRLILFLYPPYSTNHTLFVSDINEALKQKKRTGSTRKSKRDFVGCWREP
jgi:hypothetical protein